MNCTRHFLNVEWEHHSWQPRVSSTDYVITNETNMWGRVVGNTAVRCHKHLVCEVCGKAGDDVECYCDKGRGEQCAIRLACIEESKQAL